VLFCSANYSIAVALLETGRNITLVQKNEENAKLGSVRRLALFARYITTE
jgi:hypothetical protein